VCVKYNQVMLETEQEQTKEKEREQEQVRMKQRLDDYEEQLRTWLFGTHCKFEFVLNSNNNNNNNIWAKEHEPPLKMQEKQGFLLQ